MGNSSHTRERNRISGFFLNTTDWWLWHGYMTRGLTCSGQHSPFRHLQDLSVCLWYFLEGIYGWEGFVRFQKRCDLKISFLFCRCLVWGTLNFGLKSRFFGVNLTAHFWAISKKESTIFGLKYSWLTLSWWTVSTWVFFIRPDDFKTIHPWVFQSIVVAQTSRSAQFLYFCLSRAFAS